MPFAMAMPRTNSLKRGYNPAAENTIIDVNTELMLDRQQVMLLGKFNAEAEKKVRFRSAAPCSWCGPTATAR